MEITPNATLVTQITLHTRESRPQRDACLRRPHSKRNHSATVYLVVYASLLARAPIFVPPDITTISPLLVTGNLVPLYLSSLYVTMPFFLPLCRLQKSLQKDGSTFVAHCLSRCFEKLERQWSLARSPPSESPPPTHAPCFA